MRKSSISRLCAFLIVFTMFAQILAPMSVFAIQAQYTLSFSGGPGSGGTAPSNMGPYTGDMYVMLPDAPDLTRPKYEFDGWSVTKNGTTDTVTYAVYAEGDASTVYTISEMFTASGEDLTELVNIPVDAVWKPAYWTDNASTSWNGAGTVDSPYEISSPEDLALLSKNASSGNYYQDKYFKLTSDLDMSDYFWKPIFLFNGHFDGDNHVISNLSTIDETSDPVGLIGNMNVGASVSNLGVTDIQLTGKSLVGGLVGINFGIISRCYATGSINATGDLNEDEMIPIPDGSVGGLVGCAGKTAGEIIEYSYADVDITYSGDKAVEYYGGFIGDNDGGKISNCYSRGDINVGTAKYVGGFAGSNGGTIEYCYSTGKPQGTAPVNGDCGLNQLYGSDTVTSCFFDSTTSGTSSAVVNGFTAKDTTEMRTESTYTGWDFEGETTNGTVDIWTIEPDVNDGYPYFYVEPVIPPIALTGSGIEDDPYIISDEEDLLYLSSSCETYSGFENKWFKLTADLDMSGSYWTPIATFAGNFDGDNHVISGLTSENGDSSNVGLFGALDSSGIVMNLGVVNAQLKGTAYVGGIAGTIKGNVYDSYATGSIVASSNDVGGFVGFADDNAIVLRCFADVDITNTGLDVDNNYGGFVGENQGAVIDCYSRGDITTTNAGFVGGFVGNNLGSVAHCYSTGKPTGGINVAGGCGSNSSISGMVTNCLFDSGTSGVIYSDTFYPISTSDMKASFTYTTKGWDFAGEIANGTSDTWRIKSEVNEGYPYFSPSIETQVNEAKDALSVSNFSFSGDDTYNSVTNGFTIPVRSPINSDINITWTELGDSGYITMYNNGVVDVVRPAPGEADAIVHLQATLSHYKGGTPVTKEIDVTIKAIPPSPAKPSGTGETTSDPYIIDDVQDLKWIDHQLHYMSGDNNNFMGKYFKQTADIDMSTWTDVTPIGGEYGLFEGLYDGQMHKIKNLTLSASDVDHVGLFTEIAGDVRNILFDNCDITVNECSEVGILAGSVRGADVTNCHVLDTCDIYVRGESTYVGGIAGDVYFSTIAKCSNASDITVNEGSSAVIIGGIVGTISRSTIRDCYNKGNAINTYASLEDFIVGGILGYDKGYEAKDAPAKPDLSSPSHILSVSPSTIIHCYNVGGIDTGGIPSGKVSHGGITGMTGSITEMSSQNNFYLDTATKGVGKDVSMYASPVKPDYAPSLITGLTEHGMYKQTDAQMKDIYTFVDAGWNGVDVWYLYNGRYPQLIALRDVLPNPCSIAIEEAKALMPTSFTAVYGTHTNFITYLNSLSGMSAKGVTITVESSENSGVALDGAITYTPSQVTGAVTVLISKEDGFARSMSINVTVPMHQSINPADEAISAAKAMLPSSFTAVYGTYTNLLDYLNSLEGMSAKGVTLTLDSSNANVADTGAITYTNSEITGNVVVHINKAGGTEQTKTISVTVPAHQELSADDISIGGAFESLPTSFSAIRGTHTNLLTYLSGVPGVGSNGVTLTLLSSNANVSNTGVITYTSTEVIGNVAVTVSKGTGTPLTKTIAVTIPTYTPPSNNDGDGRGSHSTPTAPPISVGVNGQLQNNIGTGNQQTLNGIPTTTIVLNPNNLNQLLSNMNPSGNNFVSIGANPTGNGAVTGQLTGDIVRAMEARDALLEVRTGNAAYTLPASQINIDSISRQLGENVQLRDIVVNVSVGAPPANAASIVENTANRNQYQLVVRPVAFDITCTYGGRSVAVSRFNGYVERTVAIPEGIDPTRITTGIVLNQDGTFSHVPTVIMQSNGNYYARINSLTNSVYSVIYNPVTFKDVEKHWVKDIANDLGSRLVVTSDAEGNFNPDTNITRAEFTAVIVKALGLTPGTGAAPFKDIKSTDKYAPFIETAYKYGLVTGYEGKFSPNDLISRAEAMTIIDRMMKIAKYDVTVSDADMKAFSAKYTDFTKGSSWAEASVLKCLKSGIMVGKGNNQIDLQSNITNAETAAVVQRLLVGAKLINEKVSGTTFN